MNAKLEFIDSNVLIYAYDTSELLRHTQAKALIRRLWQSGNGAMSIQVTQEFTYNISRKVKRPLQLNEVADILEEFKPWKFHSPTLENVARAARSVEHFKVSFWDALILESASALGCGIVWSEDLNHGRVYAGVKIQNPFLET